ncbi:conjugal transfer protein TraG N-terminal domain-containing protein [Mycetohabitans endofungorum]|uniref:conjugal transfer protein TraG N-terminal domain-containing protein n=1 Tax=Mycetohabitans endofungorum TaxID=417203 RepID=UPI0030D6072B
MIDIELHTYWNVETLYYVFNAVASVMGGAGFSGLLKYVFILAIALGIFAYAGNKQLEMAKWFFQALVFTSLLNMPIARVVITDQTGLEPPRVVDRVPFALAGVAQANNLVFGFLTRTYETVFGVPDDLGLQKGDVGFGHRILKQVNNATVRDPGLRADLMQFIKECTFYDVRDGEITPQTIVGGTDTWNVVFNHTSPARFVTYDTLTSKPITDTCTGVAAILKQRVDDAVVAGQRFYGKQAFTRATSDAIATSMFMSAVGTSYDWILNNASNASDAIKQSMFNNIWKEAGAELPVLLNDPARVSEVSVLAGAAQAARQADGSNSTLSLLAQETLPHMRNWIEAIIYGLFPVLVVLMVVLPTEGAKKVFGGYLMSLAWIGLWPVLFAMINHLSLMHLRYKARALELAAGVPFQLSDAFDATLTDEQAMIGYMVVLVPFIAGAVIKMGQGGFMSVSHQMFSGFASAGSAIGSGMASGNVSMGQAGLDTASVNTTSMHKYDSNIGLSGGGATIGRGDGSVATMAANGAVALQQFQNRMLTQMGLDKKFESSRNQEAHQTDITSSGDQLAYRHSDVSNLTDAKGHDSTRGVYQQHGVQASTTEQGGYGGQHTTGQSLGKDFREGSNFNMQAGAQDALGMNLGVGGGSRSSSGARAAATGGGINSREEKRIADSMRQGGATQQQINEALDNYRASKGGGAGSIFNVGLGFDSRKFYSAEQGRNREVSTHHGLNEVAHTERHFSVTGARSEQTTSGQQSNQTDRHSRDATRSSAHERGHILDESNRHEYGVGDRASRSETDSFSVHKDLMADPYLFEKVAARNGMTAMRFANQSENRIMEMVSVYVTEKGMVEQSKTMPRHTFAGERLPITQSELKEQSVKARAEIPENIASVHKNKVAQTGYHGARVLNVDTSAPPIVGSSKDSVHGQLDPKSKGSIPARAQALDENVNAWASPDKEVGAGRANPMGAVESMELRDVTDYGKKVLDKITGGDGTADGEKLSDNMKRESAANVQINTGEKKD